MGRLVRHAHRTTLCARLRRPRAQRRARRRDAGRAVDLRVRAATVEAALERLFADCANDAACARAFPSLRDDLAGLLARAESEAIAADVADPRTGEPTPAALDRDTIVNLLRGALYTR